jgi:hypothetical protein
MTDQIEIEIFVAMNEDGGWVVATDEADAATQLDENEGGCHRRIVMIKVKMTPPQITEASIVVPDEAGNTVDAEAA